MIGTIFGVIIIPGLYVLFASLALPKPAASKTEKQEEVLLDH